MSLIVDSLIVLLTNQSSKHRVFYSLSMNTGLYYFIGVHLRCFPFEFVAFLLVNGKEHLDFTDRHMDVSLQNGVLIYILYIIYLNDR